MISIAIPGHARVNPNTLISHTLKKSTHLQLLHKRRTIYKGIIYTEFRYMGFRAGSRAVNGGEVTYMAG